jgi:hypothetical protein
MDQTLIHSVREENDLTIDSPIIHFRIPAVTKVMTTARARAIAAVKEERIMDMHFYGLVL